MASKEEEQKKISRKAVENYLSYLTNYWSCLIDLLVIIGTIGHLVVLRREILTALFGIQLLGFAGAAVKNGWDLKSRYLVLVGLIYHLQTLLTTLLFFDWSWPEYYLERVYFKYGFLGLTGLVMLLKFAWEWCYWNEVKKYEISIQQSALWNLGSLIYGVYQELADDPIESYWAILIVGVLSSLLCLSRICTLPQYIQTEWLESNRISLALAAMFSNLWLFLMLYLWLDQPVNEILEGNPIQFAVVGAILVSRGYSLKVKRNMQKARRRIGVIHPPTVFRGGRMASSRRNGRAPRIAFAPHGRGANSSLV